jgi:Sugar (and other) transporter
MSSFYTDIPDEVYDKTHDFYSSDGLKRLRPRSSSQLETTHHTAGGGGPGNKSDLLHSVYMAAGIHFHITEEDLKDLPRRFETGNVKARFNWFGALCLAGIGMFVEAYVIITTGQIKTIWHSAYPTCFEPNESQTCPQNIQCCGLFPNTPEDTDGVCSVDTSSSPFCDAEGSYQEDFLCKEGAINSISYSEFAGIMIGMLVFGSLVDSIGRNATGILVSSFMVVGVTVMTFVNSENAQTLFLIWSIFFGLFGLGVGGEYPLSASNAAELQAQVKEEAKLDDEELRQFRIMRDHERTTRRGETIGFVFAMQGVGATVGSVFLLVLIYFSAQAKVEW